MKVFVILRDDSDYTPYEGYTSTCICEIHLNQETARKRLTKLAEEVIERYGDKENFIICMDNNDDVEVSADFDDLDYLGKLSKMNASELKKLFDSRYNGIRFYIEEYELVE